MNMSILPRPVNYISNPQRRNSANINFGCNKVMQLKDIPSTSFLSAKEINDYIFKLVNKIQFVGKILGVHDKTVKPVATKLGDATVCINMDKSPKNKVKINLYSDNEGALYEYSREYLGYIPVQNPGLYRQSLDIVVNEKDKRMIDGQLNIVDCSMNFSRNLKTGKRDVHSNKCFHFSPNLNECYNMEDSIMQFSYNSKATNTVNAVFFNLFANLTKVKPDISLLK